MSDPEVFANVPAGVDYGRVTAFVTSFEADSADDDVPDSIPLSGSITLTPRVGVMNWPNLSPPQKSVMSAIKCPIIDGVLFAPGTTAEAAPFRSPGVVVVATDQPDAQPNRVQYEVQWNLEGARVQPSMVTIDVPADSVVDLATVVPATPEPGVVTVVSTEALEAAEAAALRAEAAADRAEQAEGDGGVSLPSGSAAGEVLTWSGSVWGADPVPPQLPAGGSNGQLLAKNGAVDYAVKWVAAPSEELPSGGSTGQVLAKQSGVSGDVGWDTLPATIPVPSGASKDDVLVFDGTGWEPSDVLGDIGTVLDGILGGD